MRTLRANGRQPFGILFQERCVVAASPTGQYQLTSPFLPLHNYLTTRAPAFAACTKYNGVACLDKFHGTDR